MISLIHPSRSRPKKAFETIENWIAKSSGLHMFEHILSIDSDDPHKDEYLKLFSHAYVHPNDCVVQAANNAAVNSTGDILIYLSDDFDCPQNWDDLIMKKIASTPNNNKVILRVNDLGKATTTNQPVLTIPIMTRQLYNHLGYFFHPAYKSMWVDVDLYYTTLDYLVNCMDLIFPHLHHSEGHGIMDDVYKRSESNWNQGAEIFNNRAATFGWPKRATLK